MNEKEIISALNATGKECFISYLEYFIDSQLSNEQIASVIQKDRGYTNNSCRSRTSKARSILKNNRLKEALKIIIESDRTDYECRKKAQEHLGKINQQKTIVITRNRAQESTETTTVTSKENNKESSKSLPPISNPIFSNKVILSANSFKFKDFSNTVEKELTILLGKITIFIQKSLNT